MSTHSFERILVPLDGSQSSRRALGVALSLCTAIECRLTILAIEGRLPAGAASIGEIEDAKRRKDKFFSAVLEDARSSVAEFHVEVETDLVVGSAVMAITRYASAHGHDLIVIGRRRHRRGDWLHCSTATRVAHRAHCPVIVA